MKRLTALVLFLVIINIVPAFSAQLADPVFESATATLKPSKKVTITLDTLTVVNSITITKCWIQKEISGTWVSQYEFTYNYGATNTATFSKTIDYSDYITTSGKYRIKFTAEADGHSITRYSNSRTF